MTLNFGVLCFALINRTEFGAWKQLAAKTKLKICSVDCGPGIAGSILDFMEAVCKGLRKVGNDY